MPDDIAADEGDDPPSRLQSELASRPGLVEARSLTFRYRSRKALDGLSFSIGPGVTGLLGPNGAGKTTLMSLICGFRRPSAGQLMVLGHDSSSPRSSGKLAKSVGFLPQTFGFVPGFTVRDFVAYAAWLKCVPGSDLSNAVERAVTAVGLADRNSDKLRTLSGGMLRRAGIAAAIVHQPPLLLLDEPTAGLDPAQRLILRDLLVDVSATTSVVISTHLTEDVWASCDRVLVIDHGQSRFDGTPSELVSRVDSTDSVRATALEEAYLSVLTGAGQDQPR